MEKTFRRKIIFAQWVFLGVTIGGAMILFNVFLPNFYEYYKNKQINDAYQDLKELDLANLEEDDYAVFADYEKENLMFTIADENIKAVYTTRMSERTAIYRDVEMRKKDYSHTPSIVKRESKLTEPIKLLGIIMQNEKDYYICIKDKTSNMYAFFNITQKFLGVVFLVTLLIGSVLMMCLVRKIVKPIEKLAITANKVSHKEVQFRAEEHCEYKEINQIAKNMNYMARQIEKSYKIIEGDQQKIFSQSLKEERMEKVRKEFITNISHELKTPLTVISSQLEMLEYVKEEKEKKYYYISIKEEISKMSDMVNRLQDMNVMEHYLDDMVKKVFNMKEVVEYMVMKYQGILRKKRISVKTMYETDSCVYGDRDYTEQVINNYIVNAIQHTEIGGSMRISVKKEQEYVWVGVYNDGMPIDENEMEHIWKSFYRTQENGKDAEVEKQFDHMGIGLYLVQNIINMQEGEYGVENLEEGVEFWFTLPYANKNI